MAEERTVINASKRVTDKGSGAVAADALGQLLGDVPVITQTFTEPMRELLSSGVSGPGLDAMAVAYKFRAAAVARRHLKHQRQRHGE